MSRHDDVFWERRGTQIYVEDCRPGKAKLIKDYHGELTPQEVQVLVNAHNLKLQKDVTK